MRGRRFAMARESTLARAMARTYVLVRTDGHLASYEGATLRHVVHAANGSGELALGVHAPEDVAGVSRADNVGEVRGRERLAGADVGDSAVMVFASVMPPPSLNDEKSMHDIHQNRTRSMELGFVRTLPGGVGYKNLFSSGLHASRPSCPFPWRTMGLAAPVCITIALKLRKRVFSSASRLRNRVKKPNEYCGNVISLKMRLNAEA